MNLSKFELDKNEIDVLERGLTFIPAPKLLPISTLINDKNNLIRSIKLRYFFRDNKTFKDNKRLFVEKSAWEPPQQRLPPDCLRTIEKINKTFNKIIKEKETINNNTHLIKLQEKNNMSKNESQALKKLGRRKDIIIKPADKGGATVIMNVEDYVKEAQRQLKDTNYYRHVSQPTHSLNVIKILKILESLENKRFIDKKQQ